jgi:hypothetical protein
LDHPIVEPKYVLDQLIREQIALGGVTSISMRVSCPKACTVAVLPEAL